MKPSYAKNSGLFYNRQLPITTRKNSNSDKAGEIKEWVRLALGLEERSVVSVAELKCPEPDCPPLETRVTVFHADGRRDQYRWHKGLDEMTLQDMAEIYFKRI